MKPIHASSFPLEIPTEEEYAAIENALQQLLNPLGRTLGMKFVKRLRRWLTAVSLPKRCLLLEEDQIPQGVYFVLTGSVLVGTGLNGDLQVSHILRQGYFVLPLRLFSGSRSMMGMRTAEPTRLLFMDAFKYEQMLEKFPEAGTLTNLWRDHLEAEVIERKLLFKDMDAFERLCWLYRKWPDCFMVYNDELIGAYLDLSRETVCRHKLGVIRHCDRKL